MHFAKRQAFIDAAIQLAKKLPATPLALTIHYQVPYNFMVERGEVKPCIRFSPHILYLYYGEDECYIRTRAP